MDYLSVDNTFLESIKNLKYRYDGKIPEGIQYYYDSILKGENIETYMQMFSLPEDELLQYARVCKILKIQNDISELIKDLKKEQDMLENEELLEYKEVIDELQSEGNQLVEGLDFSNEEEIIEYGNSTNLLIYSPYIDESKERTLGAQSGREEQTLKSVANFIGQLSNANYWDLRKKGYIHQLAEIRKNIPIYLDGNAFERIGRGCTKVNYFRIPVSERNREDIKRSFNIDFDTIFFVVSFGDFKNEGLDEKIYYNKNYYDFSSHKDEFLNIINIFKNDFTHDTFPIAMDIISNGFKITDEFNTINKNRELV